MKKNIKSQFMLLALVALPLFFMGQKTVHTTFPDMPIDENTKLVTYKEVVNMSGTPDILFERALKWANKHYANPSGVIRVKDKEKGIVECVSNISIYTLSSDGKSRVSAGNVYYTLTIEARDNRYRYTITNLYKKEQAQFPIERWFDTTRTEWSANRYDHLHQIDEAVRKLMDAIEEGMQPEKVIVDEW